MIRRQLPDLPPDTARIHRTRRMRRRWHGDPCGLLRRKIVPAGPGVCNDPTYRSPYYRRRWVVRR